jgi:hypothetical protein
VACTALHFSSLLVPQVGPPFAVLFGPSSFVRVLPGLTWFASSECPHYSLFYLERQPYFASTLVLMRIHHHGRKARTMLQKKVTIRRSWPDSCLLIGAGTFQAIAPSTAELPSR